ncbi:MAG: glycosyltransferase [Treponema sp.]|nr:glycosyltransferase [Treponema sp.]
MNINKQNIIPKVSVVIPVYNAEKYLCQCLDSVINQSLKEIEIIIINDGSTDGSTEIINTYAEKDNRIIVYNEEHKNVSYATNLGLDKATGEYVARVDSDDYIDLKMYEEMYKISKESNLDVLRCDYINFSGEDEAYIQKEMANYDAKYSYLYNKVINPEDYLDKKSSEYLKSFTHTNVIWNAIYKCEFINKYKIRWNENVTSGADNGFYFQVMTLAKKIMYVNKYYYFHRKDNENSIVHDYNKLRTNFFIEHRHIKDKLLEHGKYEKYKDVYFRRKYGNYKFTLKTLPDNLKKEYIEKMKEDFSDDLNNGNITENVGKEIYKNINLLINNIDNFYQHHIHELIKISIIIPVFNNEEYLQHCIESILKQTLKEIEIITIDDNSQDNSLEILHKYSEKDKRIKVISFNENKSANQARKAGVIEAKGKYIIFVDSDDMLDENACLSLYNEMEKENIDILHFGTEIINYNEIDISRIEKLINYSSPDNITIMGQENMLEQWFSKKRVGHLWGKIYKSSIVKNAFDNIEDIYIRLSQDLYAIFIIMYYSKSYKGLIGKENQYYKYFYGRGIYGKTKEDFNFYEYICATVNIPELIKSFLIKENKFDEYKKYYDDIKESKFDNVYRRFKNAENNEKSKYFDCMLKYWDIETVIGRLARTDWYKRLELGRTLKESKIYVKNKKKEIKSIGVFYYRLRNGGAQRSCAKLCELYCNLGYNVVLFTDEEPTEDDYFLPDDVIRVVLPSSRDHNANMYYVRLNVLLNEIKINKIDTFIYLAWQSSTLFWDLMTIKLAGAQFVIRTAGIFTFQFFDIINFDWYFEMPTTYSYADCITVLSRVDYTYWSAFCDNVKIIQNPLTFDIKNIEKSNLESNIILWLARISAEKRPEDAINILKLVKEKIPDIKLQMVGDNNVGFKLKNRLIDYVENSDLKDNVEFIEFTTDVIKYYRNAKIKLITSVREGWCNTISEALMFGLPIICYDMPYLELLRMNTKGIEIVPQGDTIAAANKIIEILSDKNKLIEMNNESRIAAEKLAEYDFQGTWIDIFDSLIEGKDSKPKYIPTNDDRRIMQKIFDEHSINIYNRIKELKHLNIEQKNTIQKKEKIILQKKKIKVLGDGYNGYKIFAFERQEETVYAPLFSIETGKNEWDTCVAVIDLVFMPNNTPAVSDVLYLGMTYTPMENEIYYLNIFQAEFERGENIFINNIAYTVTSDKINIYLKYTGRATGISYRVRSINSRSNRKPVFRKMINKSVLLIEDIVKHDIGFFPIIEKRKNIIMEDDYSGYKIFSFDKPIETVYAPLFSIETGKNEWDTCVAVIDLVFMPNNAPAISDILYLGMTYTPAENKIKYLKVFQAEFERGENIFVNNIVYTILNDKITIYLKYTGRATGISFKVRSINSRSNRRPVYKKIMEKSILLIEDTVNIYDEIINIKNNKKNDYLNDIYKKLYGIPEKANNINISYNYKDDIKNEINISYEFKGKNISFSIPVNNNIK